MTPTNYAPLIIGEILAELKPVARILQATYLVFFEIE